MLNRWNGLTKEAINDDILIRHYSETLTYLSALLQQLSYVCIVAVGAYIVTTSYTLTMGGLIACSILSGRVLAPVAAIPNLLVQWGRAKIAVEDLENVFALELDNHDVENPLLPENISPSLACQEVKFSYRQRHNVIDIPNLQIAAGEKVAIIGSIGAGKSTLLKLFSGMYRPQEGNILFGGMDIHQIDRNLICESISYVPQEIKLFAGTLRENLIFGLPNIGDEEILDACDASGLSILVRNHPKGLDFIVPEGGGIMSGGQKQLIALTRLLLTSSKLWLLDEPTASMDEMAEKQLLDAINQRLSPEHTMVFVTHKPNLLWVVDRVIVMTPQGVKFDGPRDYVMEMLGQDKRKDLK